MKDEMGLLAVLGVLVLLPMVAKIFSEIFIRISDKFHKPKGGQGTMAT